MKDEYQKAAEILSELLEFDEVTKEKVRKQIQTFGMGHFLENLSAFDYSKEAVDKLYTLYIILRYIGANRIFELGETGGVDL